MSSSASQHWDPISPEPVLALCLLLLPVSVSSRAHRCRCGWKTWCHPSPLALKAFSSYPPALESRGEGVDDDIPRRAACSVVCHSLHTAQLWVCVRFHVRQEEASLPRRNKALAYGYICMALGVVLLLYSFIKMVILGFLLIS